MTSTTIRQTAAALGLAITLAASGALGAPKSLDPHTRFFVPAPNPDLVQQVKDLVKSRQIRDAFLIASLALQSHGAWITGGTPADAEKQVRKIMREAALQRAVPVLVAYNIPYRDCGQYSSGGATATDDYLAWIDGFAKGIGQGKAVVVLEPDALGIIPYNIDLQNVSEWCQPTLPAGATGQQLNDARYAQLNGAVDRLASLPNASVYLDGTHTSWLGAGEIAYRLNKAGVARAQGFFVNASNYEPTPQLAQYGAWVAKCLWFATDPGSWGLTHFDWCASQYYPASPHDYSTWGLTDQWYRDNVESQTSVPYPGDAGLTHFVVDSSRNGQGPWSAPAGTYSDAQVWCNPPGRGVGIRPTVATSNALLDAYLWIKVPGESDGACTRGTAGPVDPEWGIIDPAAGSWFRQQALQLARLANPPLL